MSVHVSSNVWRSCPQKHDRLLLMVALADYCNDEGYCWPSQTSLAKRIRGTERGVIRMLDDLIAEGELEIHRKGGNGRGDTTIYLLARYSDGGVCTTFHYIGPGAKKDDPEAIKGATSPGKGAVERKNHHSTVSDGKPVVNIYDAYPRKIGRPAALKAIAKALKKIDPAKLLELTQAYAKAVVGSDPQFIPHPATWFNQERFNDDPATWQRATDKKSGGRSAINASNSNAARAGDY
jgi:hypothetical protein